MAELNLEEHSYNSKSSELIYGLEDRPPLKETLFAALQHMLAIFVAIVTPPLIIAGALQLDLETTGYLVSMSLMVSGIATFIQCRTVGPIHLRGPHRRTVGDFRRHYCRFHCGNVC